jgi:osmotically-inducible protein OsmY
MAILQTLRQKAASVFSESVRDNFETLTPAQEHEVLREACMAQFADILASDRKVLRHILNALYWDLAVPSDYLSVKVEKGWVTISGEVARSYQKSCAEADIRQVSGVKGVSNEIEIKPNWSGATGVPAGTGEGGAGGS